MSVIFQAFTFDIKMAVKCSTCNREPKGNYFKCNVCNTIVCNACVGQARVCPGCHEPKVISGPDVCKTPTPGGPVPIPYPNTSKASDTSGGSKKVKIDGKTVISRKRNH